MELWMEWNAMAPPRLGDLGRVTSLEGGRGERYKLFQSVGEAGTAIYISPIHHPSMLVIRLSISYSFN